MIPLSLEPICVASRMRWLSPPLRDLVGRSEGEVLQAYIEQEADAHFYFFQKLFIGDEFLFFAQFFFYIL